MESRRTFLMLKRCVVDSSFVAAFLLQEEKGKRFEKVFKECKKKGRLILVPGLFTMEVNNIFLMAVRRDRISRENAREIRMDLEAFGFQTVHLTESKSIETIYELAENHQLTYYDATYLELAIRTNSELKTLDKDLLKLRKLFPFISDI
jgi:predicted nucleic acid-binding protein